MKARAHPDFLAHPDHQWYGGKLDTLLAALTMQCAQEGGTVWRVLYGGALVSLRRENSKRVISIRRSKNPGEQGAGKFANEIDVFMRAMKIQNWRKELDQLASGIGVLLYEP